VGSHAVQPETRDAPAVPSVSTIAVTASLGTQSVDARISALAAVVPGEGRLEGLGFSPEVINRLSSSRASSTRKQYKSKWTAFVAWAEKCQPPRDASVPSVSLLADFLEHLFSVKEISPNSIANYKSAVLYYWKQSVGFEVPGDDSVLRDLLSSFKREKPPAPRTVVPWNLKLVLEVFRSEKFLDYSTISDKELTLKTVFLIALASEIAVVSSMRSQELT